MVIEAKNIIKTYDSKIVLNIPQLKINSGEIFGLVGNNGAGKTTFLRLMLDLLKADEGNIFNNGIDVSKNEKWKTFTGSYLDRTFLIDYLKPEEFFTFVGLVYGMSDAQVSDKLAQFEGFFNEEILGTKKYIRKLSEGNIQKVGIAAALLPDPKVVILDEPFANLDPTSQNHLKRILEQHCEDKNVTIILSSHNLNHVVDICTHIVLLEKGKIIKEVNDVQSQVDTVMRDLSDYFEK